MTAIVELRGEVAIKSFQDIDSYHRELKVYQSALPHVPKLVDCGKVDSHSYFIQAERIFGIPYLDEPGFSQTQLAAAISAFHLATLNGDRQCLCHIDNQPKNILLSGHEYFFIDFSDSRRDYPETDISHLLLFWAAEYEHQQFVDFTGSFITEYQRSISLQAKLWHESLKQSITRFDLRRRQHGKASQPPQCQNENRLWLASLFR
ncbi:MAG: phosphotransferase [Candidatus Cloacimonadaceae bacterium]|nr:phosphotransferase [Candidatus Cloacimonadota bacterium]